MSYLIVRVEDKEFPIGFGATRHRKFEPTFQAMSKAAQRIGYEIVRPSDVPLGRRGEYKLIAYVYLSPNKEGKGRAGSALFRWPARKAQP